MTGKILLTIYLVFMSVLCSYSSDNIRIVNPVLPGDRPDPSIIRIGDEYWATATTHEWCPLFPIFKSKNLVDWELVNYVFPNRPPEWALRHFWAPELSYDEKQKKVYAYYTARDKYTNRLASAVAVADSPDGTFVDLGPLISQELGSIDAFEVRDENNILYLLWKEDGNSQGKESIIWAQQMTEDRTKLIGKMHPLFKNDQSWEDILVEGVCVFRKNGYYYATYSAGACCDRHCNYKTGIARSKKLLGEWEKYTKNPILSDNEDWYCPGHGTLVNDGTNDYFLYHAYSRKGSIYLGRQGVLQQMFWDKDGWPYFENNVNYDYPSCNLDFVDNFSGDNLSHDWQWTAVQNDIKFKTGNKGLLLGASNENNDMGTLLIRPMNYPNFTIDLKLNCIETQAKGGVGIIGGSDNGFGAPIAGIGILADYDGIYLWSSKYGKLSFLSEKNISLSEITISLKVEEGYLLSLYYRVDDDETLYTLTENYDISSYVPWGMGFKIGLISKGNQNDDTNFKYINFKTN